jgi:CubicO group peptidase (beta-lactamase class C family)
MSTSVCAVGKRISAWSAKRTWAMQKRNGGGAALVLVIGVVLVAATAQAEQAPTGPSDPREVEAFFDQYLATQMAANHIAGAAVAVVKDDQVLLVKGYGYADVARRVPVDGEKTVFVLGSLSKVFTWTAVMQLVEQGKLDLDADVNSYLDFQIPATYRQAITLNHLMAHNSGFEDNKYRQMATSAAEMIPLGAWLKTHIPARVRPPGELSAYGNYGPALAGYVVERVSGMAFDDYVDTHIIAPLGMAHTSSRQPVPAALRGDLSRCYRFVKGEFQPQATVDVAINAAPAGSFRASASDMARFMIAHLNGGRCGQGGIFTPATAQLMHRQSFSHDRRLNGMAHGFWELDASGEQIVGHAGSHFIFNSLLLLFPERGLGVFIATNSEGGNAFIGGNFPVFHERFVKHYFAKDVPALTPPASFSGRAGRFAGSYHLTYNRSDTTPEKLFALMALDVAADEDGLTVTLPTGTKRFVETEPLVFRQVDSDALLVFRDDGDGRITHAFFGPIPLTALIKNRWFEAPAFNIVLLVGCILAFVSFLVAAAIGFFARRRRGHGTPSTKMERVATMSAGLVSGLSLLLVFAVFGSVFDVVGLYTGKLPLWTFVPATSVVVALIAVGMIVCAVLAWRQRSWSLAGRLHYSVVTLAAAAFVWFLSFWNLLATSL